MAHDPTSELRIGQRVYYIDSEGDRHPALIVDDCPGEDYATLVRGSGGELDEDYISNVTTETSVYPHPLVAEDGTTTQETAAYIPTYWDGSGE